MFLNECQCIQNIKPSLCVKLFVCTNGFDKYVFPIGERTK